MIVELWFRNHKVMRGIAFYSDKATNLKRLEVLDLEPDERLERAIFHANPDDDLLERIFSKLNKHKKLELWIEIPNGEPCFNLDRLPRLDNIRKLILRSGWNVSSLSIICEKIKDLESLDLESVPKKLSLEPIKLLKKLKRLQIHKSHLGIEVINDLKLDYLFLEDIRKPSSDLKPLCDEISFGGCSEEFIKSFKVEEINIVSLGSSRSILSLSSLSGFKRIKSLYLYELHSIESLSDLKSVGKIENLFINHMRKLKLDENIEKFVDLSFLKIVGDTSITQPQLKHLNKLSQLKYGQIIIEENKKLNFKAYPLIKLLLNKEEALFQLRTANL